MIEKVNLLFFKPNEEKPLKVHANVLKVDYDSSCKVSKDEKVSGLICSSKELNTFLYKEMKVHESCDDESCDDEECDHSLCHSNVICLLLPDHTIKCFVNFVCCESRKSLECACNWNTFWHNKPTWQYE